MSKPKIYLFINQVGPGPEWFVTQALSEDGWGLGSHVSSSESFAKHDIGLTSSRHHDTYREHYPDGYEVEWVDDPKTHAGVGAAYALNQKLDPDEVSRHKRRRRG